MSDAARNVERALKLQPGTVLAREVQRLRGELARRDTAGDELAAVMQRLGDTPIERENWNEAAHAIEAWRAARGDAPTADSCRSCHGDSGEMRCSACAPADEPDAGEELFTVSAREVWSAVLVSDGGEPDGVIPNTAQCNRAVGLLRRRHLDRDAAARERLLAAIENVEPAAPADGDAPTELPGVRLSRRSVERHQAAAHTDLLAGSTGEDSDPDLTHDMAAAMNAEMDAQEAAAPTDGQAPAGDTAAPVRIPRDPDQVTAHTVQAVWDEEGPDGVADWIRDMTSPAADTAAPDPIEVAAALGPGAIEVAARQLFRAICDEHERGVTFPVRVSVCMDDLRQALGEEYPDAAARPARDADGGA